MNYSFKYPLQDSGNIQVRKSWQVAFNGLLSTADDTMQSAFVSKLDQGGEYGLNDGGVELHQHCLW